VNSEIPFLNFYRRRRMKCPACRFPGNFLRPQRLNADRKLPAIAPYFKFRLKIFDIHISDLHWLDPGLLRVIATGTLHP
jgi:hypothetical protein